jgi:competence protein ComEC
MIASQHSSFAEECIFLRPLVPVTLALVTGILAGTLLPGYFGFAAALFFLAAVQIVRCVHCRRNALFAPLLVCAAAGYLSIQPWLGRELPADHVGRYVEQGKWEVRGTVVEPPEGMPLRPHFILKADHLSRGQRTIAVTGRIRISARGDLTRLHRGDCIALNGYLHAVRGFCNPDGFDYERYMALQDIHARLYAPAERIRIVAAANLGWRARLDGVRSVLSRQMSASLANFPPETVQLLQALTLGERDGLDDGLQDAFSRAGVSHVLAISGLHIGMVAMAAFALFVRLLVWMPPLLERAWVRRVAAALSLLPVFGYGLLAGLSPSTERAMIMAAVFLLAFWIGRPYDWLTALAAAALTILIAEPPALMSISFQLSFAAVLTILIGMRTLPFPSFDRAAQLRRRLMLRGAAFAGVSLLAAWGTAPLVMRCFNQISLIGPLSNLLVVPLIGFLVVPAGLLGILCTPVSAMLAALCWKTAALGLMVSTGWVRTMASFDYAAVTTVTPSVLEMSLFYLLTASLFLWKHRTVRLIGLCIVVAAGAGDAAYWVQRRFSARHMWVTAVDVGQGSANVLQLPGGAVVLVDGGGFSDNSVFDVGRSVLAPFLWSNKIKTIDLVILTHPDSDHLNGLLFVLRHFKVCRIWSNHEGAPTTGYRQFRDIITQRGIRHVPLDWLPLQSTIGPVQLNILNPDQAFFRGRGVEPRRDPNDDSLVTRVSWKHISFLFTGDIMAQAEEELLLRCGAERLHSTILLVPHHGSRKSGKTAFIQAVRPNEGIISAGWNNRFHFPHAQVLQRLDKVGCRIWRTDQCGAVTVLTDGERYRMQTCRSLPARPPAEP